MSILKITGTLTDETGVSSNCIITIDTGVAKLTFDPAVVVPPPIEPPVVVDPPVTPPVTTGWPDMTNTGVPSGAVLKAQNGDLTITKAGQIVDGLDISGTLFVKASNVVVKNCRIKSDGWTVVDIDSKATGVVIQDCTINGLGGPQGSGNQGIQGRGSFLRNNISGCENGITLQGSGSIIKGNYIHDLQAGGSPHYDGIQIDGGISNVQITHNTIINNHDSAGAIMIDNYFGAISNIVVDDNVLAGGSFTIYSDASFNKNSISGVVITNNHIQPGQYGPVYFKANSPTYTGNKTDGADILAGLKLK